MLNERVLRRDFMKMAALGALGVSQSVWFDVLASWAAEPSTASASRPPKSAILLWMAGGPAQSHTFDVKDGNSYRQVQTAVPNIRISEHLPKVAEQMGDMALLRSMSTGDGNHASGNYLMHTGFRIGSGGGLTHPSLGAIVAHELGRETDELPNFVAIGNNSRGPGHLGPRFAPLHINANARGLPDIRPVSSQSEVDAGSGLLKDLNDAFLRDYQAPAINAQMTTVQRAVTLMHSNRTRAFNVDEEPAAVRSSYGTSAFGTGCLLARRLVEQGVRFVEVSLGGWDTHQDADGKVRTLSNQLDPGFGTLVRDLKDRGMLDRTLVIWMGEFGRGPGNGSPHYARCWTSVLAGAGLRTGQVIGSSGARGANAEERPISAPDFFATVCRAMDINHTRNWMTRGNRPLERVGRGARPVTELFA